MRISSAPFKHFIFTRFNVPNDEWSVRLNESWHRKRIWLFEEFCFPSVKRQCNQNFKWIVFFDKNSPDYILENIDRYQDYANFEACFLESFDFTVIEKIIFDKMYRKYEYFICTRLDNDDVLASTFVDSVQCAEVDRDLSIYSPNNGLMWQINNNKLYNRHFPSNPFISCFFSRKNYFNIFKVDHNELIFHEKLLQVENKKPTWLQIVHSDNVSNSLSFDCRRVSVEQLAQFDIAAKYYVEGNLLHLEMCLSAITQFFEKWVHMRFLYESMKRMRKK